MCSAIRTVGEIIAFTLRMMPQDGAMRPVGSELLAVTTACAVSFSGFIYQGRKALFLKQHRFRQAPCPDRSRK